jgi:hypothetical protein
VVSFREEMMKKYKIKFPEMINFRESGIAAYLLEENYVEINSIHPRFIEVPKEWLIEIWEPISYGEWFKSLDCKILDDSSLIQTKKAWNHSANNTHMIYAEFMGMCKRYFNLNEPMAATDFKYAIKKIEKLTKAL